MKISAVITTYTEEARIESVLKVCSLWAAHTIVIDKGSTDNTTRIADSYGCTIIAIPYSDQGHEDPSTYWPLIRKAIISPWVFALTPGDIPSKNLVRAIEEKLDEASSANMPGLLVPTKYYSFGIHSKYSPWYRSYCPKVINLDVATPSADNHQVIDQIKDVGIIPYAEETFVLHHTHPNAEKFLRSHVSYALGSLKGGDAKKVYREAVKALLLTHPLLGLRKKTRILYHAWSAYKHMVALVSLEALLEKDVKIDYTERSKDFMLTEWNMQYK